jgi:antitoxin HicB
VKFRVTIEPDEDGVFVAECPALPGCISQGKTRDEAMVNIRDAIQGYLESLKKHGEPIPAPITEAVVEVSVWAVFLFVRAQTRPKLSAKLATHSIIKPEAISFCDIRPDAGSQFQVIASWAKERCAR